MTKPTYEDALTRLFDEAIKPFKVSHEPIEGQQIYISTADIHDNPFAKMVKEYLKTIKEE